MSLYFHKSGLQTTIQDGGRIGFEHLGIPRSGFMDVASAQLANLLVANSSNDSLLECTVTGPTIEVLCNCVVAITGADMNAQLNSKSVQTHKAIQLQQGDVLQLGSAQNGQRTYIAIAGGLDVEAIYGSKSTYLPAKLGGLNGRAITKGDVIPIVETFGIDKHSRVKPTVFSNHVVLDCTKGPEWDLLPVESQSKLLNTQFTISKDSNRIGIRLEGAIIQLGDTREIMSSPTLKGVVQIPSSGKPIIMMADAPTTGGYLRALVVKESSLYRLSQLIVSGTVTFIMG